MTHDDSFGVTSSNLIILGKMIQAAYIPEVNYLELFPAAANQKTALNLDSA
jgi:hypothetical protein